MAGVASKRLEAAVSSAGAHLKKNRFSDHPNTP
jgi:hypothetical protein